MRELTISEACFISAGTGAIECPPDKLDVACKSGFILFYTGLAAEGIFAGYAGYHVASTTALVNPVVGAILGVSTVAAAFVALEYGPKIYDHFSK